MRKILVNFFKGLFRSEMEQVADLVKELLDALRDEQITYEEMQNLKEKAFNVLIDFGFDKDFLKDKLD